MRFNHLTTSLMLALFSLSYTTAAHAEGSRTLYPATATGARANNEWTATTNRYGPSSGPGGNNSIIRRTILKVYAQGGENILLGSSSNGINLGRIRVYDPGTVTGQLGQETVPGIPPFTCLTTGATGRITSRALELQGPQSVSGTGNPTGYVPCVFNAPSTGIYSVAFIGPDGDNTTGGSPTGDIAMAMAANFDASQGTTTAAWDVTVRSSDPNSITDLSGRVFSYIYSLFTGGNNRPLGTSAATAPRIYPITLDGYIYEANANRLDPNGFIIYGNQRGFLDSDGITPLYRDVVANVSGQAAAQLNSLNGPVNFAPPEFPIFLNNPNGNPNSAPIIASLGIPSFPIAPQITPGSFSFTGNVSSNTSTVGTGGTFDFATNTVGVYELIISRDSIDFDPTNPLNKVLRGVLSTAGPQTVTWNGQDNSGTNFPVGSNYAVRVRLRGGEYHFPLIDAENSLNGGPSFTLQNPPGPHLLGNSVGFYDDRSYRTLSGVVVNPLTNLPPINTVLCGTAPPNPPFSDPLIGFNTTTAQRAWGNTGGNDNAPCTGSFGDAKGLDTWIFFPSAFEATTLNIVSATAPTLTVNKTVARVVDADGTGSTTPGDTLEYTIVVTNTSANPANTVVLTDSIPTNTTYVPASLNITVGANAGAKTDALADDQAELNGANLVYRLGTGATSAVGGTLAGAETSTVTFRVTINDPVLPAGTTTVSNQAILSGGNFTNVPSNDPGTVPPGDPTVTPIGPRLRLVKRITAIRTGGTDINFTTVLNPTLTTSDPNDGAAGWPAGYLQGGGVPELLAPTDPVDAIGLRSNDEVEYTIYFLSDGAPSAGNFRLCDPILPNQTYIPTTYNALTPKDAGGLPSDAGIALALNSTLPTIYFTGIIDPPDRGQYVPPPTVPANCNLGANPNGAVVVDVTQPPNASGSLTTGSYGFIRFRARIN